MKQQIYSAFFSFLFICVSLQGQDFERVAPKEPTEFEDQKGNTLQPLPFMPDVPDGETILIPKLKGVLLVGRDTDPTEEEVRRTVGGVSTINVQVPGSLRQFTMLLTEKFLNRPLTKQGALELKREVILYYRRWGRPVVTVEVPQQKISEGVLELVVIEGKLGKVKAVGNQHFSSKRLEEYIRLEEGQAIDSDVLITDLDWINRNPFRQVDVIYSPGEIAGTTDIRLLTTDRRPWRVYAGVDNTGYDETDTTRLFAGVNWGNVFGLDQILSLQFTMAPDPDKFWAVTGHYTIPLPWRDVWVFYGGYSEVKGDMDIETMRTRGDSSQISTRYNFLLQPHPGFLHDCTLGFDFKRTNNNLEFGGERIFKHSVNLTQFVVGYNAAYDTDYLKTSLTLEIFYSPGDWLPDQSNSDYQEVRPGAESTYLYGRIAFAPIIRLPNDFAFTLTLRGQASSANLLPSEQFGLGGYNTIRGYKEREVNVDDAFLASAEVRTPPLSLIGRRVFRGAFKDELQLLAFLDYGIGRNNLRLPGEPGSQYLLGVGPGLRYDINPYLNFRLDLGFQLKKLDSRGFRFHFGLVASY